MLTSPPNQSIRKNPARRIVSKSRPADLPAQEPAAARRRLVPAERERMIVDGSVRFFSEHGLDGQLRDLARGLGITHTLMYHYFPTKQALIERVYAELFEGRWRPEWERLLDDKTLDVQTKLTRFYTDYARVILERDWVRIFIFSGMSDRFITERYFAMLKKTLFPRLLRESRAYRGLALRGKPDARELELLMGLHGGIFYMGIRRWVYGHAEAGGLVAPDSDTAAWNEGSISDRVCSYLLSLDQVLAMPPAEAGKNGRSKAANADNARLGKPARRRSPPTNESAPWPIH